MANDPHSIIWQGKDPSLPFISKNALKVKKPERYRAGKAPSWIPEQEEGHLELIPESRKIKIANTDKQLSRYERLQHAMQNKQSQPGERRQRVRPAERVDDDESISPGRRRPIEAAVLEDSRIKIEDVRCAEAGSPISADCSGGGDRRPIEACVLDDRPEIDDRPKADRRLSMGSSQLGSQAASPITQNSEGEAAEARLPCDPTDQFNSTAFQDAVPSAGIKTDECKSEGTKHEDFSEEQEALRLSARQRVLLKRKLEEQTLASKMDVQSTEESESGSESSESEDEYGRVLLKPIFLPKGQRPTDDEKRKIEAQEERLAAAKRKQEKIRKEDAKVLLAETIKKEDEQKEKIEAVLSDAEMPDDHDEDEDEQYELWKIRELRRLKRDIIERRKIALEKEEIDRRRNMTDAEREEDDKRIAALEPEKKKGQKYQFMQKYFHKGAYFMDGAEDLYNRDFNEALDEEKIDRSAMPKVMQLRRGYWGMKSQVKHTHLTDVDTTDKDSAWVKAAMNLKEKIAGQKSNSTQFSRPSAR